MTILILLSAGAIETDGNAANEEILCLVDDDGNKEIFTSKSLVDIDAEVFMDELRECMDKGKPFVFSYQQALRVLPIMIQCTFSNNN